jgi:hypothetical protein
MEIIRYLGDKLAEKMNISPPAARGLIKLSIKDELGPFKELYKINYNEYLTVLKNSFRERLMKLEIPNFEGIVNNMLKELELNQSLITIAGV